MNEPANRITHSTLHAPLWRFCGSHDDIRGGLVRLGRLPSLADALQQARVAAEETLQLFEQQVVGHHVDEETELFAAVRQAARGTPQEARVEALVAQLTAEHRAIEQAWTLLRPEVAALATGQPATPDLRVKVTSLMQGYFAHARLEEEEFLPLADAVLARRPEHLDALDLSLYMRQVPKPPVAYY